MLFKKFMENLFIEAKLLKVMGNKLDTITEDAYNKVSYLSNLRREGSSLVDAICYEHEFDPYDVLNFYNSNNEFTKNHIKDINSVYANVETHEKTNISFKKGRYREELIDLMEEIIRSIIFQTYNKTIFSSRINDFKKRQQVHRFYFDFTKKMINLTSEDKRKDYFKKIEELKSIYFRIYHGKKVKKN